MYTNDARFRAVHRNRTDTPTNRARFGETSPDWKLHIEEARVEDSGVYECQVNTEPKRSKKYELTVVGKTYFQAFFRHFAKKSGRKKLRFLGIFGKSQTNFCKSQVTFGRKSSNLLNRDLKQLRSKIHKLRFPRFF